MFDTIIGALLVATWVNRRAFLIAQYFRNFRKDPIGLKSTVVILLIIDTVATVCQYIGVYLYAVTHFGDTIYAAASYWPIPVYLVTNGVVGFIVQSFLTYRFWVLSKLVVLTIIYEVIVFTMLAGSIACAYLVSKTSSYADRIIMRIPVTIWLVASAVGDAVIALGLIWRLNKVKTPFSSTSSMIKRLMYTTIQTGSTSALVAIIVLVLYLHQPNNNVCTAVGWCLGRIYSLTFLYNLNTRTFARHGDACSSSGVNHSMAFDMNLFNSTGGIQVSRSHVIHVDTNSNTGERYFTKKGSEDSDSSHQNDLPPEHKVTAV
ncbi:hypothetical protein VKT23_008128 [Stygiomarasmius scandens]|uniref:DUF6534 domain-containing protein n=1 Tax=Marasmiellus scandens TaxID=2682957 RepID=A0ABR1JHD4_9AGAR